MSETVKCKLCLYEVANELKKDCRGEMLLQRLRDHIESIPTAITHGRDGSYCLKHFMETMFFRWK